MIKRWWDGDGDRGASTGGWYLEEGGRALARGSTGAIQGIKTILDASRLLVAIGTLMKMRTSAVVIDTPARHALYSLHRWVLPSRQRYVHRLILSPR